MLGERQMSLELMRVTPGQREIIDAITVDHDLPLGLIADADMTHPLLAGMDEFGLRRSTRSGTVCMLLNAGPFHAEIIRLSREESHPVFGSSANISLSGTKFRVEDSGPEILALADIVIDHGLRKYHHYRASGMLLDIGRMEVVRFGSCYELIRDLLAREFGIALPDPPER
jgi:hypothetical protein